MEILQALYDAMGISGQVNGGDMAGLSAVLFLLLAGFFNNIGEKGKKSPVGRQAPSTALKKTEESEKLKKPEQLPEVSWSERLKKGLSRSRSEVWGKIAGIAGHKTMDAERLEEIEELLYGADIGPSMAAEVLEGLQKELALAHKFSTEGGKEFDFKGFISEFFKGKMEGIQKNVDQSLYQFKKDENQGTKVIFIMGVNGAGKTTTIGKLATKLTGLGASVIVGACDTFRAAAVDQLAVWCERAGAEMVRTKEGGGPTGVAYEALERAINKKADYCLLDTAGRLHTKGHLMEELKKTKNVLKKLDETAPHETLLVIDAITGQNALQQALEFNEAVPLTGLIFTKCDGSSKAGSAVAIVDRLKVPIAYIGVGEDVSDLNVFNLEEYLAALLGT